jgi:hypothetical protein
MGFVLRLIAQISLIVAPLAFLVYFQLQFLPYHDEKIVWWLRIAVERRRARHRAHDRAGKSKARVSRECSK